MKQLNMKKINKNISIEEQLLENLFSRCTTLVNEKKDNKKTDKKTEDKETSDEVDLKNLGLNKDDIEKSTKELDEKKQGIFRKVLGVLGKMLNTASDSLLATNLEDFTLGNFREAVTEIYKKKLSKMSDEDLQKEADALHSSPGYDKADKKSKLDSRKDDNTNTEIDESSCTYKCQFYSTKDEDNLLKQLNTLTTEIQKQAASMAEAKKKLAAEIKSKKIEGIGDGEIDAFGPTISNMLKDGKSPEEISMKVLELKSGVKESYDIKVRKFTRSKLLTEGKVLLTEKQKNIFLMEAIVESDWYADDMARWLISEGFWDKVKATAKVTGALAKKAAKMGIDVAKAGAKTGADLAKAAWNQVPQKFRDKIKDMSEKALGALKDGALAPILSIAGISLLVVTGSWGIALILACMTLISKHGKYLKAAFDKHFEAFKNSKGVIAQMDFNIKGHEDLKYSMRFYIIDQVWRVLNLNNQSKTPSLDFAKAIVKSGPGTKFTQEIIKKWDPVFSKDKGGKIDFKQLLSQAKDVQFSEAELKLLEDFKGQYDKTVAAINKPAIDTRSISTKNALKQDVKDTISDVTKVTDKVKGTVKK